MTKAGDKPQRYISRFRRSTGAGPDPHPSPLPNGQAEDRFRLPCIPVPYRGTGQPFDGRNGKSVDGGIRRPAPRPRLGTSPSATFLDFDARREPALTLTPALSQMEREKIVSACPAFRSPIGVPGSPSMAGLTRAWMAGFAGRPCDQGRGQAPALHVCLSTAGITRADCSLAFDQDP